jgi:hypothetical protein
MGPATSQKVIIMPAKLSEATEFASLEVLVPNWERSLRAGNKSAKTIRSYGDSARLLETFLRDSFGVTAVATITRDHVETFIEDQLARWKPDHGRRAVPQPSAALQVADRGG